MLNKLVIFSWICSLFLEDGIKTSTWIISQVARLFGIIRITKIELFGYREILLQGKITIRGLLVIT